MAVDYKTTQPVEYFRKFLEEDVRPDGRELSDTRPLTLNVGSISTADGSALVKLGNTTVICGVKAELTKPKDGEPKAGIIVPNVDLPPLCSPTFKSGPPSETAQAATIFMDDLIKSSQCLPLDDLCVVEEKLCWVLYCDMMCLDYDGNLLDACTISLIAALRNTSLPTVTLDEESGRPQTDLDKRTSLNVVSCPVATTFAVFDDKILFVDPTQEEGSIATGVVTIATSGEHIHMVHKPGGSPLTPHQLQTCTGRARVHTQDVARIIDETILNVER